MKMKATRDPLHKRLTQLLKGRKWISASAITLIMFLLIIGPTTMLMLATVDEFKTLKELHSEAKKYKNVRLTFILSK